MNVDYAVMETPQGYKCDECGATGCKLWREYETVAPRLLCADHAAASQGKDISDIDSDGRHTYRHAGSSVSESTDQIGWYVPAVPDEEGVGYWGYMAVPEEGIAWWRALPTRAK